MEEEALELLVVAHHLQRGAVVDLLERLPLRLDPAVDAPEHDVGEVRLWVADVDRRAVVHELAVQPVVHPGAGRLVAVVVADREVGLVGRGREAEGGLDEVAEVVLGRERCKVVDLGEAGLEGGDVAALLLERLDDVRIGRPAIEHLCERRSPIGIVRDLLGAPAILEVRDHRAVHGEELEALARISFLQIRARLTDPLEPAATRVAEEVPLAAHVEDDVVVAPLILLEVLVHLLGHDVLDRGLPGDVGRTVRLAVSAIDGALLVSRIVRGASGGEAERSDEGKGDGFAHGARGCTSCATIVTS